VNYYWLFVATWNFRASWYMLSWHRHWQILVIFDPWIVSVTLPSHKLRSFCIQFSDFITWQLAYCVYIQYKCRSKSLRWKYCEKVINDLLLLITKELSGHVIHLLFLFHLRYDSWMWYGIIVKSLRKYSLTSKSR